MQVDILIVSCARHFPWLKYSLRSIVRFATGFRQVKVLVPSEDLSAMSPLLTEFSGEHGIPIRVVPYEDWPDKGFLRHEDVIMRSDTFSDADFFCHIDSDCLFSEPVTPADYFVDGKPVLMHATYHWLVTTQQANLGMWQVAVEKAIGGHSENEFMRRHPAVHSRLTYFAARQCIEAHHRKPASDYIRECENAFPQTFCEFNTLGQVAWDHLHDRYHWHNCETKGWIEPHKIVQFWSHASPEEPQEPVFRGKPYRCTPAELLKLL